MTLNITSHIQSYKNGMHCVTTSEGLHIIRKKAPNHGYKVVKAEELEDNRRFLVTIVKLTMLKAYEKRFGKVL